MWVINFNTINIHRLNCCTLSIHAFLVLWSHWWVRSPGCNFQRGCLSLTRSGWFRTFISSADRLLIMGFELVRWVYCQLKTKVKNMYQEYFKIQLVSKVLKEFIWHAISTVIDSIAGIVYIYLVYISLYSLNVQ